VTDLRTRDLGLELRSPLVASASPLTGDLDDLRRLEDAGAAAAVLPSLFEEQLTLTSATDMGEGPRRTPHPQPPRRSGRRRGRPTPWRGLPPRQVDARARSSSQ